MTMADMTPLERAARAIQEGDVRKDHEQAMVLARAILAALREPSVAMGKAYYGGEWGVEQLPSLSEVWATLIDAALEEG